MIFIPIEESAAFDMLSILQVKMENTLDPEKLKQINEDYQKLSFYIKDQIGENKYNLVLQSHEYLELKSANTDTFKYVDLAAKDNGLAYSAYAANMVRFSKKKDIQKIFFNKTLREIKI